MSTENAASRATADPGRRRSKAGPAALLLAVLALAVSVVAAIRRHDESHAAAPGRTDAGREVARLTREVRELRARVLEEETDEAVVPAPAVEAAPSAPAEERLRALVDDAVETKARSIAEASRVRRDRKPTMDALARELGLGDAQRASVEREVMRGQGEVFAILEITTDDGGNLLDELVERYAAALARPDEDPGWGVWYGRVLTERIPGTGQTYAARIEAVKRSMRGALREILGERKYAELESWGVDPVDVREIPGSPGDALGRRIRERAAQMGADLSRRDDG
jgi:hypothetical protein